ncbi:hypothetical protein PS934_01771 [Pseudomonas fluorescens]|nr:hypothetical protein PS934_01771 [Pseudomonas fluorescens]
MLAQLGIDRNDPDYAVLSMGNQILGGGGFGTRLMSEVREKRGLTYGVYSGFTPMQVRGPFMINLQTRAFDPGLAAELALAPGAEIRACVLLVVAARRLTFRRDDCPKPVVKCTT